jgi:hypothetical protein
MRRGKWCDVSWPKLESDSDLWAGTASYLYLSHLGRRLATGCGRVEGAYWGVPPRARAWNRHRRPARRSAWRCRAGRCHPRSRTIKISKPSDNLLSVASHRKPLDIPTISVNSESHSGQMMPCWSRYHSSWHSWQNIISRRPVPSVVGGCWPGEAMIAGYVAGTGKLGRMGMRSPL